MRATEREDEAGSIRLGGYAATAEAAWMGVPLASEALEPARLRGISVPRPRRLPRLRVPAVFNREFGIAGATALLMASFFLSAGLGAVRQVLFNARFGAGAEASAYYAAFRLPDTLFSLIAGGALSSAFIPVLLSTRREAGEREAWRLTSLVLNSLLVFVLMITIIGETFTPLFVDHLLVPGYDAGTRSLTVTLTRIMLLQPITLVAGSVAIAVLNSRNQFMLTGLSVASHNLALIAGILATAVYPRLGIYGPTFGVVGGAVLQVLFVLPGVVGSGQRYLPVWDLRDVRLREVGRLLLPNGLAVGVGYGGFIVDTAFASKAGDPASLAALHNAFLLVGLPIALLGQAVGQAAFPRMAARADEGDYGRLRATMLRSAGAMVALSLLAIAATFVLGRTTVRVLFEHGDFTAHDGTLTTRLFIIYALGLPSYVATEVLVRALIAMRNPQIQLYTNTGQLLLRSALIALLLGALDARAIPVAFAASASVESLALLVIALRRLRRFEAAAALGGSAPAPQSAR